MLVAKNGQDLDLYCNTVDTLLHEMRENFDIDTDEIPSAAQREAFHFMLKLLSWAESFTGTLRYDVSADHTTCPEHDEHALAKIGRCLTDLNHFKEIAK
jgi:hypothetical protein